MTKPVYTVWKQDGNGERTTKSGLYLKEAKKYSLSEFDRFVHSYLILKETDVGLQPVYYKRFNSKKWERVT